MSQYEYAAVPAPRQVPKVKGVKGAETRFAHAMTELLNTWSAEGWEFVRAETLGFDDKGGLLGKASSGQATLMIFRRALEESAPDLSSYVETAPTPEDLVRDLRETPTTRPAAPDFEMTDQTAVPARPALSATREAGPAPLRPVPMTDPSPRPKRP